MNTAKDQVDAEMARYRVLQEGTRPLQLPLWTSDACACADTGVLCFKCRSASARDAAPAVRAASQREHDGQEGVCMIAQELDLLGDDAKVYKLIGPVLLKQDVNEAKANVNKRLEFINNELGKVNGKIDLKEKDAVEIRTNISNLQMEMQKRAAEAARGAVGQ